MRGDTTAAAWNYFEEIRSINTEGEGRRGAGFVLVQERVFVGFFYIFCEMVCIKVWTGTCWS